MRKHLLSLFVCALSILAFSAFSWAQCPEDTVDRGDCDTLIVTCLDCEQTPGTGPWQVRFPLLVTHDQTVPDDSIAGFVIPLTWTRTNPAAFCSLDAYWNTSDALWFYPNFYRSVFRHILNDSDPTDTLMHNRMAQIGADFSGRDWATLIVDVSTDDAYARMTFIATGTDDQGWWEGDRILLATLTYVIEDSMTICMDTTFWPPTNTFMFSRSDAKTYVPRTNLPRCFTVGPPQEDPVCGVDPTSLDFGTVTVGGSSDMTFDISNTGGGTLSGTVSEVCAEYSLVGDVAYSLTAGQSKTFTVRFAPTSAGVKNCTVETGNGACVDVSCTGTGEEAPACGVDPTSLDFGTVTVGGSSDMTFDISNTGGGTLSGTVSEVCAEYSLVGDVAYSLTAGQSKTFTVRFAPTSAGVKNCTVETGNGACVDVSCTGTGEEAPACGVDPTSLDFGTVTVGGSSDMTFDISNTGGGTLSGTVSEACADYSLVGDVAYSLTAGQTQTFTVRFAPTSAGVKNCTVETGNGACVDVSCTGTGEEAPACGVDPTSLDFGTVTVGGSSDMTFDISNTGGGTLSGTVSEACADYSLVGDVAYSLTAGQSKTFTVRFAPTSAGVKNCTVETGNGACVDVSCTGTGEEAPACGVDPTSLDFGTVTVGGSSDMTFDISNTGGGTLSGTVSEACVDYSLLGDVAYSLTAGQSKTFTVRFAPTSAGVKNCTVETGNGACVDVSCTGTGEEGLACSVDPTSLDFGTVTVGGSSDMTFDISNTGGGTLSGTVSEACADYSLVGDVAYSLTAGQSKTFTVRFAPTSAGVKNCTVETGNGACVDVSCTGTGEEAPACGVDPTSLDFGTVTVGGSSDMTFDISNTGGGTLSGTVSEACVDYSLVGDVAYSLTAGQTQTFTVRFAPTSAGVKNCTVETGNGACVDVSCTGTGEEGLACGVDPTSLDFGTVTVGGSSDMTFDISNTGGGTLSGTVSEACADYSLVGDVAYSLTAGQTQTFTVRFAPTSAGVKNCTVETGNGACVDVSCTGTGEEGLACSVDPTSLDFGTVTVGGSSDMTFDISNTGGGTLSGTVSEACADYSLVGDVAYSLTAGQSKTFTVRFAPTSAGVKNCTVETDNGACVDVSCTGTGEEGLACGVDPTSLDFGTVTVGGSSDMTFDISNTGGGTLSGTVSEVCADYSLVGDVAYSLTAGQSKTFTVRFAPTSAGVKNCTVETGNGACVDVSCTGTGEEAPACGVDPTSLDFGTVTVGGSSDMTFDISNTGGGTLSGTVSEACADYSLLGDVAYSLTAGQSKTFTVRFAPTSAGVKNCTVETGNGACVDVSCTGTGEEGPEYILVEFDIKPRSCPNPFNTKSKGVLPVAILGTDQFNVSNIDPSTVMLEGVSPLRWNWEDVSRPVDPRYDVCDCTTEGPDGFMDMTLKFDHREVLAALEPVFDEEVRVLTLTGMTYAGTPIEGTDCVVILHKGQSRASSGNIDGYSLGKNYPNPFNPETDISFTLPERAHASLTVYNVLGKAIKVLVDREMSAGTHTLRWDGRDEFGTPASSGIYFYRLKADAFDQTMKMVLMK